MATPATDPPFALGPTYGAFYMSALLCVGLWGITCVQLFVYFLNYPKDHIYLKTLVLGVWLLDTTHQVLIVKGVYAYLVTYFGDYSGFVAIIPETIWEFFFNILVSIPTQGFFVWRLWKFSNGSWIPIIFWVPTALLQMVVAFIWVGRGIHAPSALTLNDHFFKSLSITYLTTAAVVDLVLALGMTYMLAQRRSAAGFDGSARSLRLLAVLSINSGIWTAIFAILSIVLFVAFPTNVLYAIFDFAISPLYCNTLLANLNARTFVAAGLKTVVSSNTIPNSNSYNLSSGFTRSTATANESNLKWSVATPEEAVEV